MPDSQIFKATYSGVPVYEMMTKGVAVMRRRADGWLNATQILKVAGFDKPQRTRILEREVQKGEHEKVQGGYGKYQGTWIPIDRGMHLARQYSCEHLIQPIVEFQPAAKSPPLAPKHVLPPTAAAVKPVSRTPSTSSFRRADEVSVVSDRTGRASEDEMTPSPESGSSSSRTPSPIHSPGAYGAGSRVRPAEGEDGSRPRTRRRTHGHDMSVTLDHTYSYDPTAHTFGVQHVDNGAPAGGPWGDPASYGEQLLEYFISDANQTPQILINPPADFDPNVAIDDDGHTALHWAAAMGRIRIVKLLLTAGADIYKVNKAGQTALMRSVMFANNYDVRKFPELYETLHRSTLNIDHHNRTVFHHVVDVAMSKGKSHAARYYMETILARLADYPTELADVINFQDEDGETALTMAARCRSKRLVKLLIDVGANPKVANHDGKSAEDYILEDERFRMSPGPASRRDGSGAGASGAPGPPALGRVDAPPPPGASASAHKASARVLSEFGALLDGLADAYDGELRAKTRDAAQAHALLGAIQAEILDSQRAVHALRAQAQDAPERQRAVRAREGALRAKMAVRARTGCARWLADEEARDREIRILGHAEPFLPHMAPAAAVLGYPPPPVPETARGLYAPGGHPPPGFMPGMPSFAPGAPMPAGFPMDGGMPMDAAGPDHASALAKGKGKAPVDATEAADLAALYESIPADAAALQAACDALRQDILGHRARRKDALDALVKLQADAGASGRMPDYRRLIGAGCGGVPPADVDAFVGMLLEQLEQEEPTSAASLAWSNTTSNIRQTSA